MSYRRILPLLVIAMCCASPVSAKDLPADARTRALLAPPEFQQMAISPNGTLIAIARRVGTSTMVAVHKREGMAPVIQFDPGYNGVISDLDWLDDDRLLVGASRIGTTYGTALFEPIMVIATMDGARPVALPGNFFATIEGDPGHVLVSDCGFAKGGGGCNLPQVRRDDLKHFIRKGDLVIEGPKDTRLVLNLAASAGFAIRWEDDGTGRTYVYQPATKDWRLFNDGSQTGLEVVPLAVSEDGAWALVQSERKAGPDVIERYDFATGKRTEIYAHPTSDPVRLIPSLDQKEVIGAFYEPTDPTPHFWFPDHPDVAALRELYTQFPGETVLRPSVSKDAQDMILSVSSDRDPGAFYLFARKARKLTRIALAYPDFDAARQGTQRAVSMTSRDGLPLHGILTVPPGSNGKRLPLVVVPHGGPHGVVDYRGYDTEAQILAQHGYGVLQVNFRGSGGYGRQFKEKGYRQWGRAMQDDVTDATRWAIDQGVADAARICIYGASYGGYAALMGAIREPALYRCAIGRSGVYDLARMYKWGDIHRDEMGLSYLKRFLGEDKAELAANSPAQLADKVTVPVLLAHGFLDARADVKHTQMLVKAMEKRKQPVEYVEYSQTGHNLLLPSHREDFYARLLRFLDNNIGAKPTAAN